MLRRVLAARAQYAAQSFFSKLYLPPFPYHQAPCASLLCCLNRDAKGRACPLSSLNQNFLVSQCFLCRRKVSAATRCSVLMSSIAFGQVFRQFCTLEVVILERKSDISSSDSADKVYKTLLDYWNPECKLEVALDKLGINLTTALVVEVLHRIHYEEKLAFRFFTWAGRQEHYTHEPEAFNKMIDILSSTKYKIKQFRIVCDLLDYMKRKEKNSVPIEVLLTILRRYAEKHLTHLHKFAKKKKIRVKTQPEIHAFNLLIDALCKCGLVEDGELMLHRVKNTIKPNANTYNILFFGWCRIRNPIKAMGVLQNMITMGHSPENLTYNTAIDTFCRAGMVTEATDLLKFMKTQGLSTSSPTAKTYVIMMIALARNDRMKEWFTMLADMKDGGHLPDVSTYKELVEGLCLAGKIEAAYIFLEEMGKSGYPPDIVSYNCFLKVLCDNKNRDEALRLFQRIIEAGFMPSVQTYNMLIKMFFHIGDTDGAFDAWHDMDKRGCVRDNDTYCVMIEGLFGCSNPKDAIFLLEQVIDRNLKLPYGKFDALLMQLSKVGDLHAIHRLSDHMRKFYNPAMARRFALNQKRKSMSLRGK